MVWQEGQIPVLTWRLPPECRQWSIHCLGDTNTCGNCNGDGKCKRGLKGNKSKEKRHQFTKYKINTNANTKEGHKRSKYKDNYSGNVYF